MISGEVILPRFEDIPVNYDPTVVKKVETGSTLCIYGCDYKLSLSQILGWIEIYGKVLGLLEEKAVSDESDGSSMGTGTYIAIVKLEKKIPNMLPMFGQKVTV